MIIKENVPLSTLTTMRLGGPARYVFEVTELKDIPEAFNFAKDRSLPVWILGGGANTIATDAGFSGVVIVNKIKGIEVISETSDEVVVRSMGGEVWDDFVEWTCSRGYSGVEALSKIPGSVGAAPVQNIGAYGVEAKDIITGIRAWDRQEGRFVDIDPADCAYGYRTSRFKKEWKGRYIITAVTFRLSCVPQPKLDYGGVRKALEARGKLGMPNSPLTPQDIRETIIDIRRQKLPDPAEIGSAGSFFCNPVVPEEHFQRIVAIAREANGPDYAVPHYVVEGGIKVPAAWMIEQCGFKGVMLGGAQVYPKQPLVIVNESGNAAPEDVIGLEQTVIRAIEEKYGITLHPEVEHI